MIRLEGVVHHYGVHPVLRDIHLDIPGGELAAVMGPNGMGKSTLLGVMAGTLPPVGGEIYIDNLRRRADEATEWEIRKRVAYLPDHPWLPMGQTGREFLLAVGALYGIESNLCIDHAQRLVELFDLQRVGDSPIRTYSNGQKKKIAIASALITEAPVLILDEPFTGGLDPSAVVALKHVLERLAQDDRTTVVMATQIADIAQAIAHRVVVVRDGQIAAHDTVRALREQAGEDVPLEEALELLVHPQTMERIDAYFGGPS